MAFREDTIFKPSQPQPLSLREILDAYSAARMSSQIHRNLRRDEDLEGKNCVARNVRQKRGLLDIDLNVAPPEDDGLESPKEGGDGFGIAGSAADVVASDVSEEKASYGGENDLNCGVVGVGCCCGNGNSGIQSHCWNGETVDGFAMLEEKEAKRIKILNIEERKENERRSKRWNALLEVAENSSLERVENRRRVRSRESEIDSVGESQKGMTRKNHTPHKRHNFANEWNTDCAAAEVLAPPVVVRSTRGRAVAVPNKYRDSVFVKAAEFPRHNRSSKSAAAVSAKRKSR